MSFACIATYAQAQVKVGANPGSITTNGVLDVEGTSGQHTVILQNGNMGVNQTIPANKLHVTAISDPLRLEGLQLGTADDDILAVDANGVVKKAVTVLPQVYQVVATGPVDVSKATVGNGTYTNNNVDLGLSQTLTIPANRNALVSVSYSVPAASNGNVSNSGMSTYIGVRFLKNGTEEPIGSRKTTIPLVNSTGSIPFAVQTISGQYVETVNTGGTPVTLTFAARGYIEQLVNTTTLGYRFNMYAASGANFNWGKASMIITVIFI